MTHIPRGEVDVELALHQWTQYVTALGAAGWEIIEVPPADDCPDSAFIEDTMVVFKNVAVIANPGATSREPETAAAERTVEGLGYSINRIRAPGTLDGGDVLKIGDTVYVGRGGRTNSHGVRQLRSILGPIGATVIAVPLSKVLHLKSAVTALPDGTVVGHLPAIDDPSIFPRMLPVPEASGSHIVILGDDRLLMSADAPLSAALFRELGYTPVEVDISEFIKLEGCVTCLSVRLRELSR